MSKMIFSLDIGCSKIVACVASIIDEFDDSNLNRNRSIQIQAINSYYFNNYKKNNEFLFINNGIICNLEQITHIILNLLKEIKIEADCSAGSVLVNISGSKVCNLYSTAKLDINNAEVTAEIIAKLIDTAKNKPISSQYELLDYEVQEYLLDNQNYAVNPIYLNTNNIQSNLNLFVCDKNNLNNIKKIFNNSSFALTKVMPSSIFAAMATINAEEKELGSCVIDIGAGTSNIVVYENGFIRHIASIPLGGEDMTRDISSILKISRNLAEDLKLNYGSCSYISDTKNHNKLTDNITIVNHRGISQSISRKLIVDIILDRLKDIIDVFKTDLNQKQLYDIISSGIIITGGVAKLDGIDTFISDYLKIPVRVGIPNYKGNFADLVSAPSYSVSVGALYFALEYMLDEIPDNQNKYLSFSINKIFSHFVKIQQNISNIVKNILKPDTNKS